MKDALKFAEDVDAYILTPSQHQIEDLGWDELCYTLDEKTFEMLWYHVNLLSYGQDLLVDRNGAMTPYDVIQIHPNPQNTIQIR